MVIVDTSVWVDYLRGRTTPQTEWLEKELSKQRIGLTDLSLCEILQGLPDEGTAARVLRELSEFAICGTGSVDFAIIGARNFRELRRRGRTVRKTIDCLIATFCLENGHTLLHNDRHYDDFEHILGLKVIHP